MTEGGRLLSCSRRALLLAGVAASAPVRAQQRVFALGMLSQSDDERYSPQTLQSAFPDAPGGRSAAAAEIALNDSVVGLQMATWTSTQLMPADAPASGLVAAFNQLLQKGVHHVILELSAAGVAA